MSRDINLRRRAMQALARIADVTARPALERGLSDEDNEVVAWAAFGLGRDCEKDSEAAVSQLALRSVTLSVANHASPADSRNSIEALASNARALGRCGTGLAEATLRGWLRLEPKLADEAALALGTIAGKLHRLDAATLVLLLDTGDTKGVEVPSALFPFSRLTAVDANVQKRLLAVATKALSTKTLARNYAIRALPVAGEAAIPVLERVLVDKVAYSSSERSDAVRGLSRLGDAGQQALARALGRLLPRNLNENRDWLLSDELGPVYELLENLNAAEGEGRQALEILSRLGQESEATAAVQRRIRWLRCQAAAILAGSVPTTPTLLACDSLKDGRYGALALSRVIGHAPIRARRAPLFDKLAHSNDIVVREHALRWLQSHPEIRESSRILADALQSDAAGVVATAASVLAAHPERAQAQRRPSKAQQAEPSDGESTRNLRPTPEVLLALAKATHHAWEPDSIDVRLQLIDAVSALSALSEKSFIEEQCRSSSVVLRQHAEAALRNLGDAKRHCSAGKAMPETSEAALAPGEIHLRFYSDIGPLDLWLDTTFAPLASARLLSLAKQGFFAHVQTHRVVPGFVVQLGDRTGDGFGGAGLDVLPDELAPTQFRTYDVGMALSGPNTASSQFFVVLGPHPHLDGEYTRVGRAGPGWNRLLAGDVIERAEVVQ